jgi:8-oxo-dGTP pyrophosphatase MutT (NUDIX family)
MISSDGKEKIRREGRNIALFLISNIKDQILLIFVPRHGLRMLPGGHQEFGERRKETALREILEEANLGSVVHLGTLVDEYEEIDEEKGRHLVFHVYEGIFLGDDFGEVVFPQKEEGIEKAQWFDIEEAEKLPLSKIAREAIRVFKSSHMRQSLSQGLRNHLQGILAQTDSALSRVSNNGETLAINRKLKSKINELLVLAGKFDNVVEHNDPLPVKEFAEKPLILIVDDEKDLLHALKESFELSGYRTLAFSCPRHALEEVERMYEEGGRKIKAVIVDYQIPGMKGTIFIEEVMRIDPLIRSILVSGFVEKIPNSFKGTFFQKPVDLKELKKEVESTK